MKFIHTSDWHIGRNLCGVSLLEDQRHFLRQFTDYLAKERPDAVVIAGDLYDRPVPSAEAMELLDSFFSETVLSLKIPVLAIAGNHDSGQRLSYERNFLAKAGLHIVGNLTAPVVTVDFTDEWGKIRFFLLPWLDPAAVNSLFVNEERIHTIQEAYDRMTEIILGQAETGTRNILVCHGYFCAGESQISPDELGGSELVNLSAFDSFSYVAAGHIHRKFPFAQNMRYCGSILKYSPNEAANLPSVTEVHLDKDGRSSCQEISFPPLRDLRKIEGLFEDLLISPASEDYIFAELTNSELILDPARRLKEQFPNLLGISYREREQEDRSFTVRTEDAKSMEIPELFSQFYKAVAGAQLSPDAQPIIELAAAFARQKEDAR